MDIDQGAPSRSDSMDVDNNPSSLLDLGLTPPSIEDCPLLSQSEFQLLEQCDLRVEPRLRIIYCIQCEQAVQPSFARAHVLTHQPTCPTLTTVFEAHGLDGAVQIPSSPITPIPGLKHLQGWKCKICGLLAAAPRTMRRHFQSMHPTHHQWIDAAKATMHQVYPYRGETILVETNGSLTAVVDRNPYDSYIASVQSPPQNVAYQPPEDPKALDGFLYATKWHEAITGCVIATVRALAADPNSDHDLSFLQRAVEQYIQLVLERLNRIPTLVLRWVNSPTW
jgi:hypothetical protein